MRQLLTGDSGRMTFTKHKHAAVLAKDPNAFSSSLLLPLPLPCTCHDDRLIDAVDRAMVALAVPPLIGHLSTRMWFENAITVRTYIERTKSKIVTARAP